MYIFQHLCVEKTSNVQYTQATFYTVAEMHKTFATAFFFIGRPITTTNGQFVDEPKAAKWQLWLAIFTKNKQRMNRKWKQILVVTL